MTAASVAVAQGSHEAAEWSVAKLEETLMGNYELFVVIGRGEDANWNRVGAAWSNSDGGIEMCIHGLPLECRIVMQRAGDKEDTVGEA